MYKIMPILLILVSFLCFDLILINQADATEKCYPEKQNFENALNKFDFPLVLCLLENGYDVKEQVKDGSSILEKALYLAPYAIVKKMIDQGAKPTPKDSSYLEILAFRLGGILNDTKLYSGPSKLKFYQPDPDMIMKQVEDSFMIVELVLEKDFDRLNGKKDTKTNTSLALLTQQICGSADTGLFNWQQKMLMLKKYSKGKSYFRHSDFVTILSPLRKEIEQRHPAKHKNSWTCLSKAVADFTPPEIRK